ncbi:hypothetical protein ACTFIY_011439 [Dictyostelium cf. discoideum]
MSTPDEIIKTVTATPKKKENKNKKRSKPDNDLEVIDSSIQNDISFSIENNEVDDQEEQVVSTPKRTQRRKTSNKEAITTTTTTSQVYDEEKKIPEQFLYDVADYQIYKDVLKLNPVKIGKDLDGKQCFIHEFGSYGDRMVGALVGSDLLGGYSTFFGIIASVFIKNKDVSLKEFLPLVKIDRDYSVPEMFVLYKELRSTGQFAKSPNLYKFYCSLLWLLVNIHEQLSDDGKKWFRISSDQLTSLQLYIGESKQPGSIEYNNLIAVSSRYEIKPGYFKLANGTSLMNIEQYNKKIDKNDIRNIITIQNGTPHDGITGKDSIISIVNNDNTGDRLYEVHGTHIKIDKDTISINLPDENSFSLKFKKI